VAISVGPPEKSETLRIHLSLPFPILCDTERRLVREWNVCNAREKGGIARPAVFIIDPGEVVGYAGVEDVVRRVPAAEIVSLLRSTLKAQPRRRAYVPRWSDWISAIRNGIQR
jgi:peroxiredoxin